MPFSSEWRALPVVLEPTHVIIENVPGVSHDHGRSVPPYDCGPVKTRLSRGRSQDARRALGIPQRRHRTVVIGSKSVNLRRVPEGSCFPILQPQRSVGWAIGDLLEADATNPFDAQTNLSGVSKDRVDWLYENGEYDLPDEMRPDCHRMKQHTYKSVYGRLYWDQPAGMITTGFRGYGPRQILASPSSQGDHFARSGTAPVLFPDFFDFGITNRKGYAKMIGNAVPPKLAYVLGLAPLQPLSCSPALLKTAASLGLLMLHHAIALDSAVRLRSTCLETLSRKPGANRNEPNWPLQESGCGSSDNGDVGM